MKQAQKNLPIGFRIRKADELLTVNMDQIHQDAGLTRLGWQLLHTIQEREIRQASELLMIVSPFASESEAKEVFVSLIKRKLLHWDEHTEGIVGLTPQGEQFYRDCRKKQQLIRQKAMDGIGETDYQIALQTLQKIVNNLENRPDTVPNA